MYSYKINHIVFGKVLKNYKIYSIVICTLLIIWKNDINIRGDEKKINRIKFNFISRSQSDRQINFNLDKIKIGRYYFPLECTVLAYNGLYLDNLDRKWYNVLENESSRNFGSRVRPPDHQSLTDFPKSGAARPTPKNFRSAPSSSRPSGRLLR
jgi:hypothetical protein